MSPTAELVSTTYHYTANMIGTSDVKRNYSSQVFRPDVLSFDVRVTRAHVKVENIYLSGFRVLKGGLSEHRVREHYLSSDLPEFIKALVTAARAWHRVDPASS